MPRRSKKKKAPSAWEIAKPLLADDIKEGRVTDDMNPAIVHGIKDEYAVVPIQNFKTNIAALRKRIRVNQARAAARDHTAAVYAGIVLLNRRTDALNAAAAGTVPHPNQFSVGQGRELKRACCN
jgi:hypothetical protein